MSTPDPLRWQQRLIRMYAPLRQRWALVDGQRPALAPKDTLAATPAVASPSTKATAVPRHKEVAA